MVKKLRYFLSTLDGKHCLSTKCVAVTDKYSYSTAAVTTVEKRKETAVIVTSSLGDIRYTEDPRPLAYQKVFCLLRDSSSECLG